MPSLVNGWILQALGAYPRFGDGGTKYRLYLYGILAAYTDLERALSSGDSAEVTDAEAKDLDSCLEGMRFGRSTSRLFTPPGGNTH